MAALLIRQRSTTINNFMKKISPEAQESIKRDLLIILQEETDKDLLRAYSDMLSILSSTVLITGNNFDCIFNSKYIWKTFKKKY